MIKHFLISIFLSHCTEAHTPKLNENCVDDIIGKICNEQCVGILVQCTIGRFSVPVSLRRFTIFTCLCDFRVGGDFCVDLHFCVG